MKKFFVLIAVVAVVFTSCKKYDVSEEINLNSLPTVTLKGTVYAKLDETVPITQYQFAPEGTVVRVSVPYSAYDINNASEGNYVKTTKIGSTGDYSIDVPVVSRGVDATISFVDFTANVKTQNSVGKEETILKHFFFFFRIVSNLGSGQSEGDYIEINAQYISMGNDDNTLVPDKTVNVYGNLSYLKVDSSMFGKPNVYAGVPSGVKVTAMITLTDADNKEYKETKTVTIGSSGSYSIQVPMVERGIATIKFQSEAFWEMTIVYPNAPDKKELWRYLLADDEYNNGITVYNVATQTGKDLRYKEKNKVNNL
jgi:hypothetical protein